jgi:hypothetical protein
LKITISLARHLRMHAPQVVARQFLGRGRLETGHAHAQRIEAAEDRPHGAVLAAGIHALQHDQQLVLVLGVEDVLHGVELGGQLGKMLVVGSLAAGGQRLAAGVEAGKLELLARGDAEIVQAHGLSG